MAHLLFIDTCAAEATIGLAADGEWLAVQTLPDARRLGETLHQNLSALLETASVSWQKVAGIAVISGPGSYTGVRVGMATAKGLCLALDIPLITLNRLSLLLRQYRKKGTFSGNTALLLPARTGEWFATAADASGSVTLPPQHLTEAALAGEQERLRFTTIVLCGPDTPLPAGMGTVLFQRQSDLVDPQNLAPYLEMQFQKGVYADLVTATPEYLKSVYINS